MLRKRGRPNMAMEMKMMTATTVTTIYRINTMTTRLTNRAPLMMMMTIIQFCTLKTHSRLSLHIDSEI